MVMMMTTQLSLTVDLEKENDGTYTILLREIGICFVTFSSF